MSAPAYNPCMLHALNALLAPAAMERLVLLLNHVLAAEPAASARLRPHAGRSLRLTLRDWPRLLPPPPALAFLVTPAGLLEWSGPGDTARADLSVSLDAGNPALLMVRLAAGERPALDIQGDAALAADVHWLADNLRWDLEGDLERVLGPTVAPLVARFGSLLGSALRSALHAGAQGPARWAARAAEPPGQ